MGVRENAETVYVCVFQERLRSEPTLETASILGNTSVYFGSRLTVVGTEGAWVKVKLPASDGSTVGWLHSAVLCSSPEVVRCMRQTGFIMNRVLVPNRTSDGAITVMELGGPSSFRQKHEVQKLGNRTVNVYAAGDEPVDCIWFADDAERAALGGVIKLPLSARPRLLYALDDRGGIIPLQDVLAREMREARDCKKRGVLAFRCRSALCPSPQMVYWSEYLDRFAVADAKRGILLVSVHPMRGATIEDQIVRDGQSARLVALHEEGLLSAWSGERNELIAFRRGEDNKFVAHKKVALQSRPVCFEFARKVSGNVFVGTEAGIVVAIDLSTERVLCECKVSSVPIQRMAVSGEILWAGCGDAGLIGVDITDAAELTVTQRLSRFASVFALRLVEDGKQKLLMLGGEGTGLRVLQGDAIDQEAGVAAGAEETDVYAVEGGWPPNAFLKEAYRMKATMILAGMGADGLAVYWGEEFTSLRRSHVVPVPCEAMAWGRQFLACVAKGELWFVSLSEILPRDCAEEMGANYPGLKYKRDPYTGESGLSGRQYGVKMFDQFESFSGSTVWAEGTPVGYGATIIERGQKPFAIGDWELLPSKEILFCPGLTLTIGKGGVSIAGEEYAEGDVLWLRDDGTAMRIGKFRGMPLEGAR